MHTQASTSADPDQRIYLKAIAKVALFSSFMAVLGLTTVVVYLAQEDGTDYVSTIEYYLSD